MTEARYRLILSVRGERVEREIVLKSDEPINDILYWLENEYDFWPFTKKIYLLREDGVEERIL